MFILIDSKKGKLLSLIKLPFYMFITKSMKYVLFEISKNMFYSKIQNLMALLHLFTNCLRGQCPNFLM
jgi:hypothetical protein